MAREQTPMNVKLVAAVVAVAKDQKVNVSELCRSEDISRKTFYKWVNRVREEGLDGLDDRSTRPKTSPNQISPEVEDQIVRLRKTLADDGVDHGATTIRYHLGQIEELDGQVPSVAGVHRVLMRRGLVDPQPSKRPKSSWNRFEAAAPNERWQIDAMDWMISTGLAKVFNIIDDHARVAIRSRAVTEATTDEAWETFTQGVASWGPPAGVLSDNGMCFSGKLRGFEVLFEANLRNAGIAPATGRPYHPQTTGKVERFQQTLKKWLRRQDLARDIAELQTQLDKFCHIYNHQRPHQGIGLSTPIDRWNASTAARPADTALEHPSFTKNRFECPVTSGGNVHADGLRIHIGIEWADQNATVIIDTTHATILVNDQIARHLTLDRNRTYQPSGRPPGGPRRPRLTS